MPQPIGSAESSARQACWVRFEIAQMRRARPNRQRFLVRRGSAARHRSRHPDAPGDWARSKRSGQYGSSVIEVGGASKPVTERKSARSPREGHAALMTCKFIVIDL